MSSDPKRVIQAPRRLDHLENSTKFFFALSLDNVLDQFGGLDIGLLPCIDERQCHLAFAEISADILPYITHHTAVVENIIGNLKGHP